MCCVRNPDALDVPCIRLPSLKPPPVRDTGNSLELAKIMFFDNQDRKEPGKMGFNAVQEMSLNCVIDSNSLQSVYPLAYVFNEAGMVSAAVLILTSGQGFLLIARRRKGTSLL